MKNLAGDPHATTECRAELDAAGVPGAFIVGDVTTALVGDFIRRWALVEQKAVA